MNTKTAAEKLRNHLPPDVQQHWHRLAPGEKFEFAEALQRDPDTLSDIIAQIIDQATYSGDRTC